MRRFTIPALLATFAFALTLACGGGASSPTPQPPALPPPVAGPATALVYTDPGGNGWRLIRNNGSLPTRLMLTLVGPDGAQARGVGLTLRTDTTKIQWGSFGRAQALDHQVFQLDAWDQPLTFFRDQPLLAAFQFKGDEAQGGLFQKDPRYPAAYVDRPIVSFILEFNPRVTIPSGTTIPLSIPKAGILPPDLATAGGLQPITVGVGTLTAR